MASAWTPDQEALGQLTSVLAAADSPSTEAQQQVVAQLEHFSKSVPALPAYLVYIFALDRSGQSESVRLRAGLSLKNNVTDRVAQFPPEVLSYVKETVWTAMEDPSPQIRNTASSVIDWLFRTLGPSNWTDAILRLMQLMDSHSLQAKEAAYKTIANISRQSPRVLAHLEVNGQRPFDVILPTLIHAGLASDSATVRATALSAINPFIVSQPQILLDHMQPFLTNVYGLTNDPDVKVRTGVVEALNTMLNFWSVHVVPQIEPVIDFMLFCLKGRDQEEALALSAAEFLLTFTEEPDLHEQLQLHLEKFLPGLLQSMTLSPYSREVLDLDNEDHDKPDNATDVKPHIHKSRVTGATTKVPSLAARMGMTADDIAAANGGVVDEEDEEGYEKEEEDEDDEENSEWTVRVASARALESAAETFEAALLDILLPHVTQMLSSGDWYQREAAIFALGNVALGSIGSMHDHLPSLIPFLLDSLKDPHPLIRSGAAWTLGEYSEWIANSGDPETHLLPVLQGLLTVSLDNNKHAQGNAITAFAYLAKEAGPTGHLCPYLPAIVQSLVTAFSKYQKRNLIKLYEAIAHLADGLSPDGLNSPEVINALMPPLIEKWQSLSDDDNDLLYLLECLTSLVVAAGDAFKPYAEPVLQRAFGIVHTCLFQYQQYQSDPQNHEQPEKAWLVVSLDLISGLVQGLKADSEAAVATFVSASQDGGLPMLLVCLSYPEADVRQSAFAMVGDLANKAVKSLYPILDQLLPIIIDSINPNPRVATSGMESNVIWCTGELAMALGQPIEPFVPSLLDKMLPIMPSVKASASLLENTAVTIGRLALAAPGAVAPRLGDILKLWSQTMMHVSQGEEQDSALRGICTALASNPGILQTEGKWFKEALGTCRNPSDALRQASAPIIQMLQ